MHYHNCINELAISDSGFIFDPNTGSTFSATPVGCSILALIKQDLMLNEILASLHLDYDVGEADLHHHVQEFIASLVEFGLLSRDGANRATAGPHPCSDREIA